MISKAIFKAGETVTLVAVEKVAKKIGPYILLGALKGLADGVKSNPEAKALILRTLSD